jgi:hypothetical protein
MRMRQGLISEIRFIVSPFPTVKGQEVKTITATAYSCDLREVTFLFEKKAQYMTKFKMG